jgi:endonuclease-3
VEKYGGEVPKSIEELEKFPGIGRKSANMILYNAFGINDLKPTHSARKIHMYRPKAQAL